MTRTSKRKPTSRKSSAVARPMPRAGGSYIRNPDGSLRRDEGADAPETPAASPTETQADTPAEKEV